MTNCKIWRLLLVFILVFGATAMCYAANDLTTVQPGDTAAYRIGETEVIALCDEVAELGKDLLLGDQAKINSLMPEDKLMITVNAYIIKKGASVVLIDTGLGGNEVTMLEGLTQAGIQPETVNAVLLTHLHGDHIGGLLKDGERVFPNADIYVAAAELAYWLSEEEMRKADDKTFFDIARKNVVPYLDKIKTFDQNDVIVPGITAFNTAGHTPGHVGYLIEDNDKKLFIWGDLTHFTNVQMADPSIAVRFDVNPEQAIASRQAVLAWVAREQIPVAGMHIFFPGVGRVVAQGNGSYLFEALDTIK